jgi:hypothetical protein
MSVHLALGSARQHIFAAIGAFAGTIGGGYARARIASYRQYQMRIGAAATM